MRSEQLAKLGFVAFAADIYGKGVRPTGVPDKMAQSGKYSNDRTLLRARMTAALDVLRRDARVDTGKIAAIGFCFGGTAVLELARSGAEIAGVVTFHGGLSNPSPQDDRNIKGRVLVLHGADDPLVPKAAVDALEKQLTDAKADGQVVPYSGTVHSFTNPASNAPAHGALSASSRCRSLDSSTPAAESLLSSRSESCTKFCAEISRSTRSTTSWRTTAQPAA